MSDDRSIDDDDLINDDDSILDDDDDFDAEVLAELLGDDTRDDTGDGTGDETVDQTTGSPSRGATLAVVTSDADGSSGNDATGNDAPPKRWRRILPKRRRRSAIAPPIVGVTERERPVAGSRTASKVAESRRRVRIDDESEAPAPVGAQRFRQRRIALRRAAGRRRLRWFSVVGLVVVAVLVVLLLLASPLLSIRTVEVEGVVYADPDDVAEIVDSLRGEPILTADLDRAEKQLEAIAWIDRARVSMRLPSRVVIEVVERRPVAFFRAVDGFNRVIDREGRVLDVLEGDPVDYVPIAGQGPNLPAGQTVGQPFMGAAQLINALPTELRSALDSMTVTPEGDVSLLLVGVGPGSVTVEFGAPSDFQAKLVGVVNEIKRQGANDYSIIDVSSGDPSVR